MKEKFTKRNYLIFFSTILGPFSSNIIIPIFEQLRLNFGLSSLGHVSISIFFFMFPFAIFQLFSGSLSDFVNKKKVASMGFLIFIIGLFITLLSIIIKNFILYLATLIIQGIGFSFINPTVLAILGEITPKSKRGVIMGIFSSAPGIGVIFGSTLSRLIVPFGWELIFIVIPIIAICFFLFFILSLRNTPLEVDKSFATKNNHSNEKENFSSIISSTFSQIKNNFDLKIILYGFFGFFTFFTTISIASTLNEQLRITFVNMEELEIISYVSIILSITGVISIIMGLVSGYLLKKIPEQYMIIMGFVFLLSIIGFPMSNEIFHFFLVSILIYIGGAFVFPALFKITIELDPSKKGINSGIITMFQFLGYSIVSLFYFLVGIPILYFICFAFNIIAIINGFMIRRQKRDG